MTRAATKSRNAPAGASPFEVEAASLPAEKFSDPDVTAKGEPRAQVPLLTLETLWFNTGTLCNLACASCYIESSPTNDALLYISAQHVARYLDEIEVRHENADIDFQQGKARVHPVLLIGNFGEVEMTLYLRREEGVWRIVGSKAQE